MKQMNFLLRIPSDSKGEQFLKDFREYLNKDTYRLGRVRYTGKRATRFGAHTKKVDATSMRIYITDKRTEAESEKNWGDVTDEVYKLQVTGLRQKLESINNYVQQTVARDKVI